MKKSIRFIGMLITSVLIVLTMGFGLPNVAKAATNDLIVSVSKKSGADTDDDYNEIQGLLNSQRPSSDTCLIVMIPAGKYYISQTLEIRSNTILEVDPDAEIIRTNEKNIMIRSDDDNGKGGYGQFSDIMITGGTWNGNVKDSTILSPLMYFSHGKNVNLGNFNIKSCCSRHMIIIAGVDTANVDGVNFSDFVMYTGDDPDHEFFTSEGEAGEVNKELSMRTMEALHLDCISADGASEAKALPCDDTVNKNITVQNCTFTGLMSGVGNHYNLKTDVISSELTIKGNTFKNMKYTCMDIYNQNGVEISGNTATNCGELIRAVNSSDMTVSKNKVTCPDSSAESELGLSGIKITDCSGLDIKSNTISKGTHGISLTNASGTVSDNTISYPGNNGITILNNSGLKLTGNKIDNAGLTGIYSEKSNVTLSANTVKKCVEHGIAVYDAKTGSLSDNIVYNADKYGIVINNSVATLSKNEVYDSGVHGIYALAKSSVTVSENTIGTAGENGIYLNASTGDVNGNSFSKPGKNAILIFKSKNTSSKKTTVRNNKINSGAGENGIRVEESTYVDITSDSITGAVQPGIHLVKSQYVNISSCSSLRNENEGIYIYSSPNVTLTSNTISCITGSSTSANAQNKANAIAVYESDSFNVSGNTINGAENGILFNASVGTISNNKINDVKNRGIWVLSKSNAIITDNEIIKTGENGIHIYEATGSASGNTITNAGKTAIYLYKVIGTANSKVSVDNNVISAPEAHGIRADKSEYVVLISNKVSSPGDRAIHLMETNNSDVQKNNVTGNVKEGIYAYKGSTVTATENGVKPGSSVNTYANGIGFYQITGATISSNTLEGVDNGIVLNFTSGNVEKNSIKTITQRGIWLTEGTDATVKGNTITSPGLHGVHAVGAIGYISGNTITGPGEAGVYLYGKESDNKYSTVDGNTITNAKKYGVRVTEVYYADVKNNKIDGTETGILFSKSSGNSEKNTLTTISQKGIWLTDGANVAVKSNSISNPGTLGVHAVDSTGNIIGNTITSPGGTGVFMYNAKGTSGKYSSIEKNVISNAGEFGVRSAGSEYLNITGNEIKGTDSKAIHVYQTDNVNINDNKVSANGAEGIYVFAGKNVQVKNNTVIPGSGIAYPANAIALTEIQSASVSKNIVEGVKNGILFSKSSGSIENNSIKSTSERGIWLLEKSDASVQGNTISGTAKMGIHANDSTIRAVSNTISGAGDSGIYLYASKASSGNPSKADSNKVSGCKGRGIKVEMSENVTVNENTTSGNSMQGIAVTNGCKNITINNNNVRMNTEHGIYIENSQNVTVDYNTSKENGKKEITAMNESTGSGKDNVVGANGVYTYDSTRFPIGIKEATDVSDLFDDINGTEWFVPYIQFVYDRGIMSGKGRNFDPNGKIKREELTQIIYSHAGKPAISADVQNPFSDVPDTAWYCKGIVWCANSGIVGGVGNGKFGVGQNITREDLALMLFKYAQYCNMNSVNNVDENAYLGYKDSDKVSKYAINAMNWAITNGIIGGKGASGAPKSELSIDPKGNATRAEGATMIMKLLQGN
ncbi:MAG: right-handed parallel beta-helix repeat-containing protein [Lachnospiraceae bacterium]|nr:right-handed parallel beta-helix repeat-containing protein [Lachnospiraceae bacterium]